MDFYIDVKYREVYKRTFPWLRKELFYHIDAVHISYGPGKWAILGRRYYKQHSDIRDGLIKYVEDIRDVWRKDGHEPIRIFSMGNVQSMLVYSLFKEVKPEWLPPGIVDIETYAYCYVFPKIDFNKLVEQDKIDFLPNRKLSMPEIKEAIKLHVDYPSEELYKNAEWIYRLHKFYTELEQQL